jgi:hypothetical protein
MMIWPEHVAYMGEMRNTCEILVGKPEGKRPLKTTRFFRYEDNNLKMDLKEMKWEGVDWIHLTQEWTIGDCCEHDNVHSSSIRGEEFLE